MFKHVYWRCLGVLLMAMDLVSCSVFAKEQCENLNMTLSYYWQKIGRNTVRIPVSSVTFFFRNNCVLDLGPLLKQIEKNRTRALDLHILCMDKATQVKIINPSNVQRKNVVSCLAIMFCKVDLEDIVVYSNATDYRWQVFYKAAMKTPNSDEELQKLQFQINKIGALQVFGGGGKEIPEMYVKYNWPVMGAVRFRELSIKSLPKKLKHSMPQLQELDLSFNELEQPPHFPWNEEELSLSYNPTSFLNYPFHNKKYQELAKVNPNLYRRALLLDLNKIQDLTRFQFRGYLHKLSISGNGLKAIGRNCLVNLTGINVIDLSMNKLDVLPPGLFRGLNDLLVLRLDYNKISVVHVDTFKDSRRLKIIALNNNRIRKIPRGFLQNQEDLEELHLHNNLIEEVERGALLPNPQQYASQRKKVNMSGNRLRSIPSDVFLSKSLRDVDLANNFITFEGFKDALDLISKALHSFSFLIMTVFAPVPITNVNLTNNRIKSVDINDLGKYQIDVLTFALKSFKINLKKNPLLCDCRALRIVLLIKENRYFNDRERFRSWVCAEPRQLKGKPILSVPEKDFVCARNLSGCPMEGTCFVRASLNDGIIIDLREKNLTGIPYTMPVGASLELFLEKNQIAELGMRDYLGNVTVLRLSQNDIQHLSDSFVQSLTKITELRIDSNKLQRLPRSIESLTSRESFRTLAIHLNHLKCYCHSKWMKKWMTNSSDKIESMATVRCIYGRAKALEPIYRVPLEDFICVDENDDKSGHWVILSATLGTLLFLIIAIFIVVYFFSAEVKVFFYTHFDWHPFDRVDDSDPSKIYDAFISYSGRDQLWVYDELKNKLEGHQPPYKICIHDRDFEVGACIQDNILNSVNKSKRMIMVLSNSFLESEWCRLEFRAAHHKVLQDKTNYLIVILFQEIDKNALDDEIKLYLRTNTYLGVTNRWFWQKLLYSLPKPQETVVEET